MGWRQRLSRRPTQQLFIFLSQPLCGLMQGLINSRTVAVVLALCLSFSGDLSWAMAQNLDLIRQEVMGEEVLHDGFQV